MQRFKHDNKYKNYKFEDFLSDDSFIYWIRSGGEEFCKKFISIYPQTDAELAKAIDYLKQIEDYAFRISLSDEEKLSIWSGIESKIGRRNGYSRVKEVSFYSTAIAVMIVVIVLRLVLVTTPEPDILKFAYKYANSDVQVEKGTLFISDDDILILDKPESTIDYIDTVVRMNGETIANKKAASYNIFISANAQHTNLILADSTVIVVGGGTKVIYPPEFTGNTREIYVDGQIYIDVSYDAEHSFIVRTTNMKIEVLGTTFDISDYSEDDEARVVLVSGSLKINPEKNGKEYLLRQGQKFSFEEGVCTVSDVDASMYTSWINGFYIYERERFGNVIKCIGRYYGVDIRCSDEVADIRCNGKLDLRNDIHSLLEGLAFSANIECRQENGLFIFSSFK